IMETFFLQPQSVALGVPVAGIGFLVMLTQLTNMAGSAWAAGLAARLGEVRLLVVVPAIIVASLILLAAFQALPSLLFVGLLSCAAAVSRPIAMSRIQAQVSDTVRATILSTQSLMGTALVTVCEPALGWLADHAGLPAAYAAMAAGLSVLIVLLFA